MRVVLHIVIILLLFGGGLLFLNSKNSVRKVNNDLIKKSESPDILNDSAVSAGGISSNTVAKAEKTYITSLKDVSKGNLYYFTQFSGNSAGMAKVTYSSDNGYNLFATFENLPDPTPGHFYEGWVVTSGQTIDVVSTGRVLQNDQGIYINNFSSERDLTDHTFFVLTIEPDDGNPAPAAHILEGILVLQN